MKAIKVNKRKINFFRAHLSRRNEKKALTLIHVIERVNVAERRACECRKDKSECNTR